MTQRKRTLRRAADRGSEKLTRDRERLFTLSEGGSPERPIGVDVPTLVEITAAAQRCPVCEGALDVSSHDAVTIGGRRLRVARVVCRMCKRARPIYFELKASTLS